MRSFLKRRHAMRIVAIALVLLSAAGASLFLLRTQLFRAQAATNGPSLTVDVSSGRHTISNDIYGMNSYGVDAALAKELRIPVQRWGGDGTTRYNWQVDSSNSGGDWYFMGGNGQANAVPGASADQFIKTDSSVGSKSILTIPIIGYVNKTSAYNCSFPVSQYGPQQSTNPYVHPNGDNCGNGVSTNGTNLTDKNPLANNLVVDPAFMKQWVQHLLSVHGTAAQGGVQIYQMDNEPSGWGNTHRDVHPDATGYDELVSKTEAYASMVKSVDSTASVLGPSDFGWPVYLDSSKAGDNAASHNGVKFAEYYLQQMKAYEQQHSTRLLDYFDEHYYPNEAGVANSPAGDAATQALRLRSTRSLWDPTYTDESWIGQYYPPIQLIPLFHSWVAKDYPGTKVGITEYNWGGMESINGALAQADVLGIFGREQLDLATLWGPPTSAQPGAFAFRMYRNYDGKGGSFGDTSVKSLSSDQGQLAVYGAQRSSDGALTLMVINKTGGDLTSSLALANFTSAASAQVYTYSGSHTSSIVRQPDLQVGANGFTTTYPANSITTLVLPGQVTPVATPTPLPNTPPGPVSKTWSFAEGRVGAGFREYLTIDNPTSTPCTADIKYIYSIDGAQTTNLKSLMVAIPGASRITQSVNADLSISDSTTPAATVASTVTVDSATPSCPGVVVERPVYMNGYHGLSSGTDVFGSTSPGTTFTFADVPSGSGYSSYLTVLNAGDAAANVTASYYAGGSVVGTQTMTVAANTRATFAPGAVVPALPTHVAAVVTADQPITVERPTYVSNVNGISGAADIVGTQTAANDWLFSEGYTASTSQEFLTVANVDPSATANVTITLKSNDGHTKQFPVSVAARSQLIWDVNANNTFAGSSPEVSAEVTSTGAAIVVQREMFYQYHHTLPNGALQTASFTDIIGMVASSIESSYSFAEGYTHTHYNEWLTLQNPTGTDESIYVTLVNGASKTFVQSYQVKANSRYTVDITDLMQQRQVSATDIPGNEISLTVQTLNKSGTFVAERAIYYNTSGTGYVVSGGTDALGFGG